MTPELENLLKQKFKLKNTLLSVLPESIVEYIMVLIAKDEAHRKLNS